MYKQFFGLRANPFNVSPDPRYLLLTPPAEEALACLTYGIQTRRGFILLTGEVGTGKTTLVHKLLDWLRTREVPTAYSFNSLPDSGHLLRFILTDLGLATASTDSNTALLEIYNFLLQRFRAGSTTVLIIDEAQCLSQELLEEIRLLTNFETATEKLLQVVLVGQPELEMKIKRPELRALRQRIALRAKLYPLTLEETGQYIARRLQVAGASGNTIFDRKAVEAIYRYSDGIPRVINVLCELALVSAFADQRRTISTDVIESVAEDFAVDGDAVPAPENGKRSPISTEIIESVAEDFAVDGDAVPARENGKRSPVSTEIIESVAEDFAVDGDTIPARENDKRSPKPEESELLEALRGLAGLVDRLDAADF